MAPLQAPPPPSWLARQVLLPATVQPALHDSHCIAVCGSLQWAALHAHLVCFLACLQAGLGTATGAATGTDSQGSGESTTTVRLRRLSETKAAQGSKCFAVLTTAALAGQERQLAHLP